MKSLSALKRFYPQQRLKQMNVLRRSSTSPIAFWNSRLDTIRNKDGYIVDMDGVVKRGSTVIEGAKEFVDWVRQNNRKLLFLTNASCYSQDMLHVNFKKMGLNVLPSEFFTSAMATAEFVKYQNPSAKAFVIGEQVLKEELLRVGVELDDVRPDYVIMGEQNYYSKSEIGLAVNLVRAGAKLIGTNKDAYDAVEGGTIEPSTGAWISVIERAAGVPAYFIGKPSPVMMRIALSKLGLHAKDCTMIGDRMDTDIIGGVEASMDTVLVLSGVTKMRDVQGSGANMWGWAPYLILDNIGEIAHPGLPGATATKIE